MGTVCNMLPFGENIVMMYPSTAEEGKLCHENVIIEGSVVFRTPMKLAGIPIQEERIVVMYILMVIIITIMINIIT